MANERRGASGPGGEPVVGFAVVYRWRLRAGAEERFLEAWETVTQLLRERRGALGSRLHRAADGTWVAYAQWPSRAAWEASRGSEPVDSAASDVMAGAIEESLEPILLEPVRDLL